MKEDDEEDFVGWCYNESSPIFWSQVGDDAWLTGCILCGSSDCRPRSKEDEAYCEEWFEENMSDLG